jgi:hypothetical protein
MTYASEKRRLEREHQARQAAARADEIRASPEQHPKAWAWRLKRREEAGEKLSDLHRAAWRQALGEN